MHISRRVIKLPKKAEESAEMDKSPYVEKRHVISAAKDLKSITQSVMERKIYDHAIEQGLYTAGTPMTGRVNAVLSYHDDSLKGLDPGTPREIYDYIQTEDYVGYIVPITAMNSAAESGEESDLEILTNDKTIDKSLLKNSLKSLCAMNNVNLRGHRVYISVPSLKDDDAILGAAYIAIRSAVENKPLRQDACLATKVTHSGEVTSIPRLNSRLFYADDKTKEVIISGYDMENKIKDADGATLYPNTKLTTVNDLNDLYRAVTSI